MDRRFVPFTAVAMMLIVLSAPGCSKTTRVVGIAHPAPTPNTPQSVVKLFEWALNNRGVEELEQLFTDDFALVGAGLDSLGNPSREVIGDRAWLLDRLACALAGDVDDPPAARIDLIFDRSLVPMPDTRPGYRDADSLYRTIRTSLDMRVLLGDGSSVEITGYALFYLVRGDVAEIPADLQDRFPKDKSRWWISRWEDETLGAEGKQPGATDPTKNLTLGMLLGLFTCQP